MTAQNVEFSNPTHPQQEKSVENVVKAIDGAQGNIRSANTTAAYLGGTGGTLAIAAAGLVGSSPDSLSNLMKSLLLLAAVILMLAVVAILFAVYPRTKGMNNKITKEDLSKQMLATSSLEDKYNRLIAELHYLTTHILPIKNGWIRISVWITCTGVSVLIAASGGWIYTIV